MIIAIRGDPAAINVYGAALVAIARHFKSAFGIVNSQSLQLTS